MKPTYRVRLARLTLLAFILPLTASLATSARAAVIVLAPTPSTPGSFNITQDITFTITSALAFGASFLFVLDEWVPSDGTPTDATFSPNLSISINGGAAQTFGSGTFTDNQTFNLLSLTPNDGYLSIISNSALAANSTVTLKAASYTMPPISDWNAAGTQTFSGDMFMTNSIGTRISGTVAVPEPSTWAMLGLGMAALAGFRIVHHLFCRRALTRGAAGVGRGN